MTSLLQPLCLDLAAPNVSAAPDWEVSSADAFNALRSLSLLQAVGSTSGAAALAATPDRASLRSAFGLADEEETEADEDWDEDEWDDEDEDWDEDELDEDEWDDEDEEWADDADEDSEEEE